MQFERFGEHFTFGFFLEILHFFKIHVSSCFVVEIVFNLIFHSYILDTKYVFVYRTVSDHKNDMWWIKKKKRKSSNDPFMLL